MGEFLEKVVEALEGETIQTAEVLGNGVRLVTGNGAEVLVLPVTATVEEKPAKASKKGGKKAPEPEEDEDEDEEEEDEDEDEEDEDDEPDFDDMSKKELVAYYKENHEPNKKELKKFEKLDEEGMREFLEDLADEEDEDEDDD